jgi:hypothetical protein
MVAFSYPQSTLDWCQWVVDSLNDGGVWMVPRSGVAFRVDKSSQTLTLVVGDAGDPDVLETRRAFACIGWEVIS